MTLFNGICDNCIYEAGMPIICTACRGIVRGGLCLPYDIREKNLYNYDPNAYSFNNSNYFPQPQYENYLCNLCGNNSHDDYDCQQQFLFIYEQEPRYNLNYDDDYYPHELLSFPCCDYCGGSHETFQCQPDNQNVDFSSFDQIQTLQYSDINPSSPEIKSPENSSEENVVSKTNQESPQDSDIHQLIEECYVEVPEQQKQKKEDTMLELVKICQEKEFLCIHDDVDNLIESALDSKLVLINSNSQHLDKKEQEVKNVVEQPAERGNRSIQSLQNFKHLSITPETESDEVTKSNAENLLPIPSKCEVTLKDEIKCDMPAKDVCSPVFTTFSNPLFKDDDNFDFSDDESLPDENVPAEEFKIYSNPLFDEDEINSDKLDLHCFNVESDFVESLLNRDTFIDFSSKFDFSGELAHIKPEISKSDFDFKEEIRLIENLLYENSFARPPEEHNAEITDTIIESIPLLPIPVQDGNSQQEEIDIVTKTDDVLPPGIENFVDDPEGDINFLEELLIDDSILSHESFDSSFEDSPLIPRPPPEPPDAETDIGEEFQVVMNDKDKDVDYSSFISVIYPEMFPLLLSAESEDTIFVPDCYFPISLPKDELIQGSSQAHESDYPLEIEVILCRIYVRFPRSSYPFIDSSLGKFISF
uniref:Pre-mRNA splicing Prp18-interacting factor n=1 Tax=Tanacetum cinerariifolium TaxID=118510 RepID=A0A6L2L803_TANCI|nr:hypothetical protein [Tanacetum cinerariifolium]